MWWVPLLQRETHQGLHLDGGGIAIVVGSCIDGTKLLQREESILPNEEDEIVSQTSAGSGESV